MIIESQSKIESVPFVFRMPDRTLYPADNFPDFEYWLSQNIKSEEINGDRSYLPILFTSFYKTCDYGENKQMVDTLQNFLNTLDVGKKYFVAVQWDNGIINDISHLDCKVFSMAGGGKDYGLPLICQPHQLKFNGKKDTFCCFMGRITNPVRQEIINLLSGKTGYFVSIDHNSLPDYCRLLSQSVFSLCPRGYSENSFRIMESLEYGAIPVWISDRFVPIHDLNFNDFGVLIESKDVHFIDRILKEFSASEIKTKQENGKYVFDNFFSFESNKRLILKNI